MSYQERGNPDREDIVRWSRDKGTHTVEEKERPSREDMDKYISPAFGGRVGAGQEAYYSGIIEKKKAAEEEYEQTKKDLEETEIKEAEAAEEKKLRMAELTNLRAKRKMIKEARIKRARVENIAVQTGTAETSSLSGGLAGIETQVASNLSFMGSQENLAREVSGHLQASATAGRKLDKILAEERSREERRRQRKASRMSVLGGVASTIFGSFF